MIFEQIKTGGDRNFGYIIGCETTLNSAVVDPSPDPEPIMNRLKILGLNVKFIINTHDHFDHNGGNISIKSKTDAEVIKHSHAKNADIYVNDGDAIEIGDISLKFIHTPGHTPCSMCILTDNHLITGDTLFVGKVGGTSGEDNAETERQSLKKIMSLENHISVWPGHDVGVAKSSTLAEEKKSNPFIQRLDTFEDFYWLKVNWADYKLKHGIK